MTQASDLQSILMAVGRLEGRVGEAVHGLNNVNQKVDIIAEKVAANASLPHEVAEIEARVTLLEADKHQRDGAIGLGGWVFKSPMLGWLATAMVAAWAFLTGRHG